MQFFEGIMATSKKIVSSKMYENMKINIVNNSLASTHLRGIYTSNFLSNRLVAPKSLKVHGAHGDGGKKRGTDSCFVLNNDQFLLAEP